MCRDAHGTVFHPRLAEAKDFSPLGSPCKTPEVCASILIAFYGGWLEAGDVVKRLSSVKATGRIKLAQEELVKLVKGRCEMSTGAELDRIGVQMLTALLGERSNPIQAIASYGQVVDQAKEIRHLPLLVPAYIRLTSLLAQRGDLKRAIQIMDHFEKRYYRCEPGPHYPTAKQRRVMAVMKPPPALDERPIHQRGEEARAHCFMAIDSLFTGSISGEQTVRGSRDVGNQYRRVTSGTSYRCSRST